MLPMSLVVGHAAVPGISQLLTCVIATGLDSTQWFRRQVNHATSAIAAHLSQMIDEPEALQELAEQSGVPLTNADASAWSLRAVVLLCTLALSVFEGTPREISDMRFPAPARSLENLLRRYRNSHSWPTRVHCELARLQAYLGQG
jgi:hypothetical protein